MHYSKNGVGELLAARYAKVGAAATAGGTGDATEVDGAWIDRQGFDSLKVVIAYTTTLAATKTLSLAANLQDASDSSGTGAADFGSALSATVVATGASGGSTETGVVELDFDVSGADQYVRIQFTPDLSATGTDTASISAIYVLGGADANPVSASLV